MRNFLAVFMVAAATLMIGAGGARAEHDRTHAGAAPASPRTDVGQHPSCRHCGMDRAFFAHSRMLVTYADGASFGLCSINCAVIEMKHNKGRQVKSLMVADYSTKELTDVTTATWVVGGKVNGVMTSVAKWAFAGREGAEKFVKENGGRITTFEEALDLALKENE